MKSIFKNRYSLVLFFSTLFIFLSTSLRIIFLIWAKNDVEWSFSSMLHIFCYGLLYDITVVSCFTIPFTLYLLIIPNRFINALFDQIMLYFMYTLYWIILYFSFFAEITFWDEFKSRFNFIAVDYLIYTYEVVKNIQESYPLPY